MRRVSTVSMLLCLILTACADDDVFGTGGPDTTATDDTGDDILAVDCTRDGGEGCVVLGLVLAEPSTLQDALDTARSFGGTPIGIYRSDAVCVNDITFSAPLPDEPRERVASRFAYVEAREIRERRLDATEAGLSPPITGMHISQSYWDHFEEEWRKAQRPGVMIEAVALFTTMSAADIEADPAVRAVVPVPFRWSDSLEEDYPGELFMEGDGFPAGHLSQVPPIDC